ncbi:hypothetical protein CONSTELLA_126 [Mycobacterium phage Constella]|nr:hypothetical protein CONSTELLA_126 [Mycobacterium phage Constella]
MWGKPDWQWLPLVGGPEDGKVLHINLGVTNGVVVPLPSPPEALFKIYEPDEPPSALRMTTTTYEVRQVATPDHWLQYVLVHESIGWDQLATWGRREIVPLIMTAWRARWQRTVCKHCGERVVQRSDAGECYWTHATGAHAGKHRCAVEPYGYNAEPSGTPCSGPPNACAGHCGDPPLTIHRSEE